MPAAGLRTVQVSSTVVGQGKSQLARRAVEPRSVAPPRVDRRRVPRALTVAAARAPSQTVTARVVKIIGPGLRTCLADEALAGRVAVGSWLKMRRAVAQPLPSSLRANLGCRGSPRSAAFEDMVRVSEAICVCLSSSSYAPLIGDVARRGARHR
jgi:hypothetical protein